jgi:hypothetical protein
VACTGTFMCDVLSMPARHCEERSDEAIQSFA